jgi:hypothetical protein
MNIELSKRPTYKSLCRKKELVDARLYPPTKRTVNIAGRSYFLQFPAVIGAKVNLKRTPCDYWHSSHYSCSSQASCFLNLSFEKDGKIYIAPLPQVDYVVNNLAVCLTDGMGGKHVWFKQEDELDILMYWFWNTGFGVWDGDHNIAHRGGNYFGTYHKWEKMDLDQVLGCMTKPKDTVKAHIKKLRAFAENFK